MVTTDTFTYTNQDRLALHVHQIDGGDVQLLTSNTYDALGQLTSKKVGGSATAYTSLQKVDYQYNIRGWLQSINDVTGLISADLDNRDDLFAFKISYNTPTDTNKSLYNGNISETYWRTMYDDQVRKYEYTYDHLSRLLQADYSRPDNMSIKNAYKEVLTYDKNGNITDLGRTGGYEGSDYEIEIDKLVYVYDTNNKNQLIKVTDNSYSSDGFAENKDPNGTSNDDYAYDANGNMTRDDNKAITNISYNHLNLPFAITFLNDVNKNTKIEYLYDATGKKVGKKVHYYETYYPPGGGGDDEILLRGAAPASTNSLTGGAMHTQTMDQTDYLAGGYQYKNSVLEFVPHAEGFVKWVEGSPQYYFNYTDHLGNVRVTYYDKGDGPVIAEESNYYPFGLQHKGYNVPDQYIMDWGNVTTFPSSLNNKYKYQGQERQDELGLNWDSFKWRNYDYAIGRFMSIDPLAEEYVYNSPYAFQENKIGLGRELEGLEMVSERSKDGKSVTITVTANFTNSTTSAYPVPNFQSAKNEIISQTKSSLSGKMSDGTNVSVNFVEDPNATITYDFVDMIPDNGSGVPPDGLVQTIGDTQNNKISISSEGHYYTKTDPNNPNQERPNVGRTGAHETGHAAGLRHIDDKANPKKVVEGMYNNQSTTVTKVNGQNKVTEVGNLMESGKIVNPNQRDIMVKTVEQQQKR